VIFVGEELTVFGLGRWEYEKNFENHCARPRTNPGKKHMTASANTFSTKRTIPRWC